MPNLGKDFYNKLIDISHSSGINPADLLLVMSLESGLSASATNPLGGAVGLIQFMPFVLKGMGFQGTSGDFGMLSAVKQLDYVAQYIKNKVSLNGGPFKSAAQYYVANFLPVALTLPGVKAEDPSTIIVEKNPTKKRYKNVSMEYERKVYNSNPGLDYDKDGAITYGDLQKILAAKSKSSLYQNALKALNEFGNYKPVLDGSGAYEDKPEGIMSYLSSKPKSQQIQTPTKKQDSMWETIKQVPSKIVDYINNLLKSSSETQDYHTICVFGSDMKDRLEFCRIASDYLDDEVLHNKIYADESNVNIQIVSSDTASIKNDIYELKNLFNKSANTNIDLFITNNRITDLPEIKDDKIAINKRKFLLSKITKG